ncbi:hypothetical protein PGT21_031715 [Puccinia graminis f. sp. tritici]|uniref:Uncharacterized protein n=1 Tax=Puccinia graminis f. sp. tritici TaxID=56615 RepID=A0A5B0QC42_PUCGR|nr:hypothetical protein PGT21_031715 [Puccinia graminis f. sp. tritici]
MLGLMAVSLELCKHVWASIHATSWDRVIMRSAESLFTYNFEGGITTSRPTCAHLDKIETELDLNKSTGTGSLSSLFDDPSGSDDGCH